MHFFVEHVPPKQGAKSFQILGPRRMVDLFVTSSGHPLRVLSARLMSKDQLPSSLRPFVRPYSGSKAMLRRKSLAISAQPTDLDLFQALPGRVVLRLVPSKPAQLPLTYDGKSVVALCWVAPWAPGLLQMPADQIPAFFELDASFRALRPYAYIVPTMVVANYGVPLGIVLTPTERARSYELFWEASDEWDIERDVRARPLLSDKGSAITAYGQCHYRHWFCFRHILESLGSRTYVAILAHRLMFCASEVHYHRNREEVGVALEIALSLERVTAKGAERFCRLFGFAVLPDGHCVSEAEDPFEAGALWGERGAMGVAACTNHVEGLHGRLNAATANVRSVARRLKSVVEVLCQKAKQFQADAHRSAKRTLAQLVAEAQQRGCNFTECECGWSSVYSHRFGIDGFPCVHTCQQHPVDFAAHTPPDLRLNFDATIRPPVCMDDDGTTWGFEPIQSEDWGREERFKKVPAGLEETDAGVDPNVDAFVRRLIRELTTLNPQRASTLKVGDVAAAFGVFAAITQDTPNPDFQDASLKAKFELSVFGGDLH
jgi:hypothetical protein